LIETITFILR